MMNFRVVTIFMELGDVLDEIPTGMLIRYLIIWYSFFDLSPLISEMMVFDDQ